MAHINQFLADSEKSDMNDKDQPITADNVILKNVESKHLPCIRNMLRRHEVIKNGRLGNLKVAEHGTDLNVYLKPFKLAF